MNSLALKKSVRLFYICYQTFPFQIKILLDSTKLFPLFHSISQILSLSFILTMNIECYEDFFFFSGMVSFDSPESNSKIHRTMLKIPIVNRETPFSQIGSVCRAAGNRVVCWTHARKTITIANSAR